MIYLNEQLQFLNWLKDLRGPVQDALFRLLNLFDTGEFYLAIVAFIWIGISRKWGVRSFYLITLASLICMAIKMTFAIPRPCAYDSNLCFYYLRSYGFPSGGAQSAMIFATLLILYWKNRWAWVLGFSYFALISLSRMYLGVHFPVDVLGGWTLGLITAFLFYYTVEPIERYCNKHLNKTTLLSILIPLALWTLLPESRLTDGCKALTGCGVGIWASRTFHHILLSPPTWRIGLIRALFGVASSLAIFLASDHDGFLTFLWISWIAHLVLL